MTQKLTSDVVVVGSGPGGATVARDLTLKGKKVILLEKGSDNKPYGTFMGSFKYMGGLNPMGKGLLVSKEGYRMVRAITVGGTSLMYLGCAWDPPLEMFQKYDVDITGEVREIKKELNVQEVPDHLIGPGAETIMQAGLDLGYDWKKIPKFLNADNCVTNCNTCYYGCHRGAKWHARDWVLDAVGHGMKLMPDTCCDEVIVENNTATGIKATAKNGEKYEINTNAVVVSAGGVGSPAVLQRSGIEDAGKTFFFDPFVVVFGYLDNKLTPSREFPMVTGVHLADEGVMITDMMLPWAIYAGYAIPGLKIRRLLNKGMLGLLVKIRDDMEGVISKSEEISSKPFTIGDRKKIKKGKGISSEILRKLGAKDIWSSGASAAHPGGTCRIGHVVDSNLETRFKNLFVVDASVIPEPWGLPPTLSIVALGRRLSNHLA